MRRRHHRGRQGPFVLQPHSHLCVVSTFEVTPHSLVASTPLGTVTIDGDDDEIDDLVTVLRSCDGRTALVDAVSVLSRNHGSVQEALQALLSMEAVIDARHGWSWFHRISRNPSAVPMPATVEDSYAEPPWRPPGADLQPHSFADVHPLAVAMRRNSAWFEALNIDPGRSRHSAMSAVRACWGEGSDHYLVASAGALRACAMAVIGTTDGSLGTARGTDSASHEVVWFDGLSLEWRQGSAVGLGSVVDAFVQEDNVVSAVQRGAAVVVICVDPVRMTMKYGNRGWRYCLLEVGAVMHQISLWAAGRGVACRPVGGFYDDALSELLDVEVLPLLTMVVASE